MSIKTKVEEAQGNFFLRLIVNMWSGLIDFGPAIWKTFWDSLKRDAPNAAKMGWAKYVDELVERKLIDQPLADLMGEIEKEPFPVDLIMAVIMRMNILMSDVKSRTDIYQLTQQYAHLADIKPNPAPVEALIRAMFMEPNRTTNNRAELGKFGYDKTQIDNLILAHYRTVEEGTIRTCFLRGIITSDLMYERMRELGYTDTRIKEIIQTWKVIPGIGDLLQMAAKEAFEPESIQLFGLDDDFPEEQTKWFEMQGLSSYWQHKYWQQHWFQPSIGQGFEMLHRGEIDHGELNFLFKALEVPTYWRSKLTAIAYNPYTRVDARRMHAVGTLNTVQLKTAYTDIGFDSDKADEMVKFTLKFNAGAEKELTKGAILSSYESGLINYAAAKALLMNADYSSDLADFYLTMSDYKTSQQTQDLLFDNIKTKFLINKITTSSATSSLNKMGMDSARISALLANWDLERYQYELLPSKNELEDFFLNGLISEAQYRGVMSQHGYDAASINWYLARINLLEPQKERLPSKAELENFLKKGILTEDQYRKRMETLGYSKFHIDAYLFEMKIIKVKPVEIEVSKTLTKGELGRFLSKEIINEIEYRTEMKILGYSDELITQFELEIGKPPSRVDLTRFVKDSLITKNQYFTGMILLGYIRKDITLFWREIEIFITNKLAEYGEVS